MRTHSPISEPTLGGAGPIEMTIYETKTYGQTETCLDDGSGISYFYSDLEFLLTFLILYDASFSARLLCFAFIGLRPDLLSFFFIYIQATAKLCAYCCNFAQWQLLGLRKALVMACRHALVLLSLYSARQYLPLSCN